MPLWEASLRQKLREFILFFQELDYLSGFSGCFLTISVVGRGDDTEGYWSDYCDVFLKIRLTAACDKYTGPRGVGQEKKQRGMGRVKDKETKKEEEKGRVIGPCPTSPCLQGHASVFCLHCLAAWVQFCPWNTDQFTMPVCSLPCQMFHWFWILWVV